MIGQSAFLIIIILFYCESSGSSALLIGWEGGAVRQEGVYLMFCEDGLCGDPNPLVIVGKPRAFYLRFVVVWMGFFVLNIAI